MKDWQESGKENLMCIIYSNKKIRKRFLKESRLAKDTLYTVRFLIGHDILARVLFLCRRDFEGKEQGCSRRRGRDRPSFEPEMSEQPTILAVVSAGESAKGPPKRASPARRVSLPPSLSPRVAQIAV